jgi:hypothetical protein
MRKIAALEKTAVTNYPETELQAYEKIKPSLNCDAAKIESNPNTPLDARKALEQPKTKLLLVRVELLVSMRTPLLCPGRRYHNALRFRFSMGYVWEDGAEQLENVQGAGDSEARGSGDKEGTKEPVRLRAYGLLGVFPARYGHGRYTQEAGQFASAHTHLLPQKPELLASEGTLLFHEILCYPLVDLLDVGNLRQQLAASPAFVHGDVFEYNILKTGLHVFVVTDS